VSCTLDTLSPLATVVEPGTPQTIFQSTITRIDLRENVMDFPIQPIITRDNVEILVHPMLLYRLVDPVRVCYEVG